MLVLIALALIVIGPFAGGPVRFDGLAVIPTLVAPAFYVIVIFVLPLDMTMSWVFSTDAVPAERRRLRQAVALEGILLIAMLAAWAPFVLQLIRVRG